MVVETSTYPKSQMRMFYGLKQNGRPLFTKSDKETPYYTIRSNNQDGMFESEGGIIKFANTGKEYYINIGKYENNAEIISFDDNKSYVKSLSRFTENGVTSIRHAFLLIKTSETQYYYLLGFVNSDTIYFQKHTFNFNINNNRYNFANVQTYTKPYKTIDNGYGRQVSCFQTKEKLIICFYITKNSNTIKYNLHKFNKDLSDEKTDSFISSINDESLFNKCIHLKDEVGIFASYYKMTNRDIEAPYLLIKEFKIIYLKII